MRGRALAKGFLSGTAALLLLSAGARGQEPCGDVPHRDHPHAMLSNGDVTALVFLPNPSTGYYRSSRFDWSGVVGCAAYRGHTFWGEWFPHYDPLAHDAITGPVEEFRTDEGALGYDAAGVGGLFVKVGVGVLRRDLPGKYEFAHVYPIVDTGRWTVRARGRSITFRQRLRSTGVAYEYTKVLSLDRHGSTLTLTHALKNLGNAAVVTDVYDHDFFMLDGHTTGPGMEVRLPFAPVPDRPLEPGAAVEGNAIVYKQKMQPKETVQAYLTGYGATAADCNLRVEDMVHRIGVEQTADRPITKMYLWSISTTICPEAYLHLDVAPGKTGRWVIRYRLFADEAKSGKSMQGAP